MNAILLINAYGSLPKAANLLAQNKEDATGNIEIDKQLTSALQISMQLITTREFHPRDSGQ